MYELKLIDSEKPYWKFENFNYSEFRLFHILCKVNGIDKKTLREGIEQLNKKEISKLYLENSGLIFIVS